ncbi:GntR family transcriptional regulator [Streptomyces sp. AK02-01A]|uniref:GntR family transcriptional regulator n=1 Tax=Streptomyces sp. AK02-01A TaxID=3028648 RepID=UPI0029BE7D54|nr:GntR family transcriptional regulator [Streptomyces sp. AK02-01A]MDX3853409.1 GntR family transcriptional regulator [Streptomyces sp. AK02-01A]
MLIRIDASSSQPLAEQIAASVRRALSEGTLRIGDKLPSARESARLLRVNMHTVLRGYQTLKAEGLIDLRAGRGAFVVAAPRRAGLREMARQLVTEARRAGLSDEEVAELVGSVLSGSPGSGPVGA